MCVYVGVSQGGKDSVHWGVGQKALKSMARKKSSNKSCSKPASYILIPTQQQESVTLVPSALAEIIQIPAGIHQTQHHALLELCVILEMCVAPGDLCAGGNSRISTGVHHYSSLRSKA